MLLKTIFLPSAAQSPALALNTSGAHRTFRARKVWTAGNLLPIAGAWSAAATDFVARLGVRRGEALLDVGCGTGAIAIPAAGAGADVTALDVAPGHLAEAALAARAAGVRLELQVGDAAALPYLDGQFDTVTSLFGVMHAERPERVAAELRRVTRPRGRIALAAWTPDSFMGQLWRVQADAAPAAFGAADPAAWGDPRGVMQLLGRGAESVRCTRRTVELRFPFPPAAVMEFFAASYGPTVAALAAAGPHGVGPLRAALHRLFRAHNRASGGSTVVRSDYLDVLVEVQ